MKKIVKLTFNHNWPLFRQTPLNDGVWGDYIFKIDDNLTECDFWVVYGDDKIVEQTVRCPKSNTYFIPGESVNTSPTYSQQFLAQFAHLITMQTHLRHPSIIHTHNANPWFVGKSFSELMSLTSPPEKTRLLSVVSSNKAFTDGHRKRLEFVEVLKQHFGDQVDVFGRGIRDFDDKWEVLAPYKYTIAIENDSVDYWVTEKYFDCVYAYSYPFFYGCPNLDTMVPPKSFQRIDLERPEEAVEKIKKGITDNYFETRLSDTIEARRVGLTKHNLFPFLVDIFERQGSLDKCQPSFVTIKPNQLKSGNDQVKMLKRKLKNIYQWLRK